MRVKRSVKGQWLIYLHKNTEVQKEKIFHLHSLISLEILSDCFLAQEENRRKMNFINIWTA